MTLTVFTTTLGDTDRLRPPTVIARGVRYVCFTDGVSMPPPPYEAVRIPRASDSRLESRRIKILANDPALADPDLTLWHDAAFQLTVDPRMLVPSIMDGSDMLALRHPHRDRIADEADAIARLGYVSRDVLDRQLAAYARDGFTQTAITSTGLCLRKMTEQVRVFNQRWWAEVARWHWRDQMSVDYALWKSDVRVRYMTGHYRSNPYAKFYGAQPVRRIA